MSNMDMRIAITMKNNLPEKKNGFFVDVKDLTNSTFSIKNDDNDILIELNEDNGFSLTYTDNMQFKNIINFQVIK